MKTRVKNLALHGVGMLMGVIGIYGCYPFGISYFAALSMAYGDWYFIFPIVLAGMALRAPVLSVVKYGIAMMLTVILSGIIEERRGMCSKGQIACVCGGSIFAMTCTEYFLFMKDITYLYYGMAECVLAGSATVIFYQIIMLFVRRQETGAKQEEPVTVLDMGRVRLKESAQVLHKLAGCFGQMPEKKEVLSKQDVEEMFHELSEQFCKNCEKCTDCWQNHYFDTYKNAYDMFHAFENEGVCVPGGEMALSRQCIRYKSLAAEMKRIFNKTKTNMLWYNRMIESRSAVAVQLNEMARMMKDAADDIYQPKIVADERSEQIRRRLKNHHMVVEECSIIEKRNKEEVYVRLHVDWKKCVAVREVAVMISEIMNKPMVPQQDSRMLIGRESMAVLFVEDTCYRVVHGVARAAKSGERISGDNFSVLFSEDGHMSASLSDGMGCGVRANKESELVIELLERFLEAGFCQETALSMMNATLVMNDQNGHYSTVDVATVDLYSGQCDFVKLGASYTFIKRADHIETIQMETLPIGLFQKKQMMKTSRMLEDGDYVIMISDGVLSAIPEEEQVPLMEQILLETEQVNPKDLANHIMEKMLRECNCDPQDDMTVLVWGLWKK